MLTHEMIKQYMKANRTKRLGDGMFSMVFERRCGTKVSKFSLEDRAYQEYLSFIDYYGGENVPTIYCSHIDGDALYVVMEKLEHLCYLGLTPLWDHVRYDFSDMRGYDYDEVKEYLKERTEGVDMRTVRGRQLKRENELITPGFWHTYCACTYAADEMGYNNDLHSDNLMVRVGEAGKLTLVITDPWYDASYDAAMSGHLNSNFCDSDDSDEYSCRCAECHPSDWTSNGETRLSDCSTNHSVHKIFGCNHEFPTR